ncbi:copper homeostasis protein CutC, partial [bacterium]
GVLPGGGIRANNVAGFVARTGVTEVHLSAVRREADPSMATTDLRFGAGDTPDYPLVDREIVRGIRAAVA